MSDRQYFASRRQVPPRALRCLMYFGIVGIQAEASSGIGWSNRLTLRHRNNDATGGRILEWFDPAVRVLDLAPAETDAGEVRP